MRKSTSLVYHWNEYLGIKMELKGHTSNKTGFSNLPTSTFPRGLIGNVPGNLFRYPFRPQFEVRAHGSQPFAHLWFGGAHTNVYGNAFRTLCQAVVGSCGATKSPTPDALAMDLGAGVDIPISRTVCRAAQRYSNPFTRADHQKNFHYSAGIFSHSRMVGTGATPQH